MRKAPLIFLGALSATLFGEEAKAITVELAQVSVNPGTVFTQLLRFAFTGAGLLAFGAIVYGAVKYTFAAGNPSAQSDARDHITQAIIGLLLLIGSFLILYTINPQIIDTPIPALAPVTVVQAPIPPGPGGIPVYYQGLRDAEARQQLAAAGVQIKGGVSLEGIQQSVVDELIQLKRDCGCDVMVTSGTDGSHQFGSCSHASGWKADLRINSALDDYLTKHLAYIGTRKEKDGTTSDLYQRGGAVYARETAQPHWDLQLECRTTP